MKNIAIVAPSNDAYSETFIRAHRDYLDGNITFYHDGSPPKKIGEKEFLKSNIFNEIIYKSGLKGKNNKNKLIALRFRKSLISKKIDIVLCEYGTSAVNIINICKRLNIPLIVHFHGGDATVHSVIKEHAQSYKKVFDYASVIIAVSREMVIQLKSLGAPVNKIVLNPYGPYPQFHDVRPKFSKKSFIGIGRFVDKKAPYYTILAFAEVIKTHPDAELQLAGDGPLFNVCRNMAKYLGLEENIKFLGVISPEEFRTILAESLAYVQHSITAENGDKEGTPLAILEASAAGLPIISTRHAGIPDVIQDGHTGLLGEEHDVERMALNMLTLLNDIDKAREMGENGKSWILENFTLKKHIEGLNSQIAQIV